MSVCVFGIVKSSFFALSLSRLCSQRFRLRGEGGGLLLCWEVCSRDKLALSSLLSKEQQHTTRDLRPDFAAAFDAVVTLRQRSRACVGFRGGKTKHKNSINFMFMISRAHFFPLLAVLILIKWTHIFLSIVLQITVCIGGGSFWAVFSIIIINKKEIIGFNLKSKYLDLASAILICSPIVTACQINSAYQ